MKTKDKIIHCAIELFNEQGERQVTTNHIAAHLGISPGNLYYHFRNKEDIIHSIFDQYAHYLNAHFTPSANPLCSLRDLMGYLDAIFYLMWQFRFFYANLPDILNKDAPLQQKYLTIQGQLRHTMVALLKSLRQGGIIAIDDNDLPMLSQTIKMLVTSWIPFQLTHSEQAKITKSMLYQGVLNILFILRPYIQTHMQQDLQRVEAHYQYLSQQIQ